MKAAQQGFWPELTHDAWKDTRETLHRWLQVVGKIRLAKSPWVNHSWQSALYISARGVTTSLIHDGPLTFAIQLDFTGHVLQVDCTDGRRIEIPLRAQSVAAFYGDLLSALEALGISCRIDEKPNELPDTLPFSQDLEHQVYDAPSVWRFWQALLQSHRVMQRFGAGFSGKSSPIHLFWGGLDLALTRFSGRRAPEHPGGIPHIPDLVVREAYSHEVSSCGFWPGDARYPHAAFYSYAYPEPPGYREAPGLPEGAFYYEPLREFILPYERVRQARDPDALLLRFFQTTYAAAATCGNWDAKALAPSPYLERLQKQHELDAGKKGTAA